MNMSFHHIYTEELITVPVQPIALPPSAHLTNLFSNPSARTRRRSVSTNGHIRGLYCHAFSQWCWSLWPQRTTCQLTSTWWKSSWTRSRAGGVDRAARDDTTEVELTKETSSKLEDVLQGQLRLRSWAEVGAKMPRRGPNMGPQRPYGEPKRNGHTNNILIFLVLRAGWSKMGLGALFGGLGGRIGFKTKHWEASQGYYRFWSRKGGLNMWARPPTN